ncbi:GRAM domain-containing protein [Rhizohabitans arisaemae]|uniref:GRAM domain-containing protein n=1 Tax=Rhizohabitans arisaemae TaxID=2720610 RepID=UPI0024B04094|nr:GRAM domain-containing protein [Rhizohabitans arisaemae]
MTVHEPELDEVFRNTEIVALPGETLLRKGNANLWRGKEAVGGRLWLTSRWLVFRSHSFNNQTGVGTWPLEEIASVAPVNTLGIVPNGMEVTLGSGERIRFVVSKRREWMTTIMQAKA